MTIGRRMTATATVPLRKVREATVDALETLEQHTAVINGQGFKLKGLGERVADVVVGQEQLGAKVLTLQGGLERVSEHATHRIATLETLVWQLTQRVNEHDTFIGRLRWLFWGPRG